MDAETWTAPPGDEVPNHPSFAVLVYRRVPAVLDGAETFRALLAEQGWGGTWTDGVFPFHHFHSTAHEVLGVLAGSATLELGGPQGRAFEVERGDVLVLPAGTGHRRARDDGGFRVMGGYPAGQEDYDLLRGGEDVAAARARIAVLAAPPADPVGGTGVASWR